VSLGKNVPVPASNQRPAGIRDTEGAVGAQFTESAMVEELIPIVMFIVIGVVLSLYFYFRFRTRNEMQETVRVALEKGQELSPELIDRLGEPRKPADRDLRRGVIAMALALACISFGYFMADLDDDVFHSMLAIAMLPFFISLAYLLLWKFGQAGKQS
jgi:Domain of unknown function (DUF6249)